LMKSVICSVLKSIIKAKTIFLYYDNFEKYREAEMLPLYIYSLHPPKQKSRQLLVFAVGFNFYIKIDN
jgi:hypothetical protein